KSPLLMEKFLELTSSPMRKKGLIPLLDVCTRWGSTNAMIERALGCKDTFTTVLLDFDLEDLVLNEFEWKRLKSLQYLLQQFDTLTTKACASKTYPTIPMTVVIYNRLMDTIEKYRREHKDKYPDICHGALAAYNKLRRYYTATDKLPIYSVATALHPAMRFKYWTDQNWGAEYEGIARQTVRNTWLKQYADVVDLNDAETQSLPDPNNDDDELSLLGLYTNVARDELEDFVLAPLVREKPLGYWRKNSNSHPQL
ncbi:hypothetical protein BGZ76_006742, partial [Entomortierella beljakovae]